VIPAPKHGDTEHETVPPEIWEMIFVHLTNDAASLGNVRLTCRPFCAAA